MATIVSQGHGSRQGQVAAAAGFRLPRAV